MDLSLSVRFANLPNNTQFEMRHRASGPREDTQVTIAVQSESGQRTQGQYLSSETLFNIISSTIGIPSAKKGQDVVCIYMRKEVIGEELLKTTTLKSLGLTSGSAVMRVIVRDAGALKFQAHVEDLKLVKAAAPSKAGEVVSDVKQNVSKLGKSLKNLVSGVFDSVSSTSSSTEAKLMPEKKAAVKKEVSQAPETKRRTSFKTEPEVRVPVAEGAASESLDINWLGERDALVFSCDDMMRMRSLSGNEEPSDDFFEHTQDDLLLIYNDLKQRIKDLEDRPLETAALREKKLPTVRYSKTVLRICFPIDGLVIQATFSPNDSVETVTNFVKKFLRFSDVAFYLYTTPPKQKLSPQDILIKKQLVPAAMIHVGLPDASGPVLKPELRSQITSFHAIAAATKNLRQQVSDRKQRETENDRDGVQDVVPAEQSTGVSSGENKVPKWFKKQ